MRKKRHATGLLTIAHGTVKDLDESGLAAIIYLF